MINIEYLKKSFPIKEEYAYFMTAASGPIPHASHEALCRFSQSLMQEGSVQYPQWLKIMERARASAAQLLGCQKDLVAFVKNTGVGLWIASRMVDWSPGDQVILGRGEFPSNIIPWLSLEEQGVSISWIEPSGDHPIPAINADTVEPLINEKTRVLAVSYVQYDDGVRRNLKELGELCQKYGIVFVIDAIQGLGALPFSGQDYKADFVCAGSQKWLLSPPGAGILYVAPKWLEGKKVPNLGWLSVDHPFSTDFDDTTGGTALESTKSRILSGARRFEEGTQNFPVIAAMGASMDYILDLGIESIQGRIKLLTDYLISHLQEIGCRIVSPRDQDQWSGIVAFDHEYLDSFEVDRVFAKEKIITTVRNGWLRVAVDFFNDESEIDRLVCSLKKQLDLKLASHSR